MRRALVAAAVGITTSSASGWCVPRNGGGRITFSLPVDTKRIDRIGVPFIPFCA